MHMSMHISIHTCAHMSTHMSIHVSIDMCLSCDVEAATDLVTGLRPEPWVEVEALLPPMPAVHTHIRIGHNYVGHNCMAAAPNACRSHAHTYVGYNYIGHNYKAAAPNACRSHAHTYVGHNYIGHNYMAAAPNACRSRAHAQTALRKCACTQTCTWQREIQEAATNRSVFWDMHVRVDMCIGMCVEICADFPPAGPTIQPSAYILPATGLVAMSVNY